MWMAKVGPRLFGSSSGANHCGFGQQFDSLYYNLLENKYVLA